MGKITEQLVDAIEQWVKRTDGSKIGIIGVAMLGMGGLNHTFPEDANIPLTADNFHRNATIERMCRYSNHLVDDLHFHESFIVLSAIRAIDDQFNVSYQTYEFTKQKNKLLLGTIEEIAADPERGSELIKSLMDDEQLSRMWGEETTLNAEDMTQDDLVRFAEEAKVIFKTRAEGDLKAKRLLESWREVTAHILEPENLERSRLADLGPKPFGDID